MIALFIGGSLLISLGVAFVFRSTPPPQIYELFVSELSERFHWRQDIVKWVFDFAMLVLGIVLSLTLTHGFTGIGIGTVAVTFTNAPLIAVFGKLIDKIPFERKYKEES